MRDRKQKLEDAVVASSLHFQVKMTHRVVSEYKRDEENNSSNIKVYVRARPMEDETEQQDFIQVDKDDERKISIRDPEASNRRYGEVGFSFDRVFWTETDQESVFASVCKQQVDHVLNGYNSCCFACKFLFNAVML